MTKSKMPVFKLDAEEQELSDSFERGEWVSVKNVKKEIAKARKGAADYLRKATRNKKGTKVRILELSAAQAKTATSHLKESELNDLINDAVERARHRS